MIRDNAWRDFLPGYNGDIGLISTVMVRECEPGVGTRDTGECGQPSQPSQSSHLGPGVTGREPAGQLGNRAQGRQPEAGGHLQPRHWLAVWQQQYRALGWTISQSHRGQGGCWVVVTVHCSGGQHQQYTFLQVCNWFLSYNEGIKIERRGLLDFWTRMTAAWEEIKV